MIQRAKHPLYNFDFRPNFDYGRIHCEYEIKSNTNTIFEFKNYFHKAIKPIKVINLSKPFVWYKNKKGSNKFYNLLFYNYKIISHSEWHLGVSPTLINYTKLDTENPFAAILYLLIEVFDAIIFNLNKLNFKLVKFINRHSLKDSSEIYGLDFDSRKIIERKTDERGRLIYVKSESLFGNILTSKITYDTIQNLYIEELTISYKGFIQNPPDEKKKLIVYPYWENEPKPNWYNSFKDDWHCCLVFEVKAYESLKYVITKDLGEDRLFK